MLNPKLKTLADKIRDKKLRERVIALLENPTFEADGKKYAGLPLEVSPAGLSHHHSYTGSYVEHVISSANIALTLCDSVEKIYGGKTKRDFVVAGVLLHDLFKPVTYVVNEYGSYGSSTLADFMDHTSIAVSELVRKGFPIEVVHIVAAHLGEYGAIRPRTVEALICHLADLADSRLNREVLNAARYLARRAVGEELFGLTSKEAFEIIHSKSVEGWKGAAKAVEKIKRKRKTHKTY